MHRVWANRRAGLWNRAFSLVEIPLSLSRCRKAGISSSLHFFRLTCNPHFSKLNNVQLVSCHELVVQRWNIIQWFDYYQGLIVCIVCLLVQWPPPYPHPSPAFGWILFTRNRQHEQCSMFMLMIHWTNMWLELGHERNIYLSFPSPSVCRDTHSPKYYFVFWRAHKPELDCGQIQSWMKVEILCVVHGVCCGLVNDPHSPESLEPTHYCHSRRRKLHTH